MTEHPAQDELETTTLPGRRIGLIGGAVLLFLLAAMSGLALVYAPYAPARRAATPNAFPQPQLRADPTAALQSMRAEQRDHLSGYRWADADHTLVAIPIERAMALIAQRGADAYAPITPAPSQPSSAGATP